MSFTAPKNDQETGDFEVPASGTYPARCIRIVDLGTHENSHPDAKAGSTKRDVLIAWELNKQMEDGKPFVVNWSGTLSMGKRAKLRSFIDAWRNVALTDLEAAEFDFLKLLDQCCCVAVQTNGKYANVKNVTSLVEGLTMPERQNDLFSFVLNPEEEMTEERADKFWGFERYLLGKSQELEEFFKTYTPKWKRDEDSGGQANNKKDSSEPAAGDKSMEEQPSF
jgi:hypothetical protein